MRRSICSLILVLILLAGLPALSACDNIGEDTDASSTEEDTGLGLMDPETVFGELYTVMPSSSGRPKVTRHALVYKEGSLTIEELGVKLSELTGLKFSVTGKEQDDGSFVVNWEADSSLIAGLGSIEAKDEYNFQNEENLSWFMLNTMAYSIRKNLGETDVFYTMKRNRQLKLDALPDVRFPKSVAYNKLDNENVYVG